MDDSYPRPDTPADLDALDFTDGSDCGRVAPSEWCFYPEPHVHGFACDSTCPCRVPEPHDSGLIECPHWSPGRITMRRGCTACAASEPHDSSTEGKRDAR